MGHGCDIVAVPFLLAEPAGMLPGAVASAGRDGTADRRLPAQKERI